MQIYTQVTASLVISHNGIFSSSFNGMPPPTKKPRTGKPRKAILDSQRRALRAWYNDDSNGKQSLRSSGQWWEKQYGYVLNTSTLSEILSQK